MATFAEEQSQREALKNALKPLITIDPHQLVRADVLGRELSFESGLPIFERTIGLFKDLSECELGNTPYEILQQLVSHTQQALSQFQQIQQFSIDKNPSNPKAVRDNLITQLQNQWNTYYQAITPHIAYSVRRGTDFDALEREARGSLTLVRQIASDARTDRDKTLAEMQGALDKVRQAAAEAGVAQHAIHFKQEAEAYSEQSNWWLGFTIGLGLLTVAYALYSLGYQLHEVVLSAPTGRLVALALSRLIAISILSTGIVFCAHNYSATRHNFVINRHRQNALSTFETFVKAARDDQTKDAVLIQATRSIFSPQTSGYLKSENEPPQANQIVEIIRGLTATKS
jgi:hypothetical protein